MYVLYTLTRMISRIKLNTWKVDYNLGRFLLQVTGHRSQVIVLPIQKMSQTLVKANIRPN